MYSRAHNNLVNYYVLLMHCIIKKYCVGEDCVCQVFCQDVEWNKLNIEFTFFPKKCLEVSYLIDSGV